MRFFSWLLGNVFILSLSFFALVHDSLAAFSFLNLFIFIIFVGGLIGQLDDSIRHLSERKITRSVPLWLDTGTDMITVMIFYLNDHPFMAIFLGLSTILYNKMWELLEVKTSSSRAF
jgi:integral membrane sensor domain MASE1